ncbi:hypothetical protein GCM10027341_53950 [Spirosoma knui]
MKTLLFVLLLGPVFAWAQFVKIGSEDTQRRRSYLLMRDGTVVRGQILRQDSTIISVRRRGGDMSFVEADQVVQISADRPIVPSNVVETRSTAPYKVFVFRDGSQVEGTFVKRDSTMITVRKRNGQLTYFEPELLVRTDSVLVETQKDTSRRFPTQFSPWLLTGVTAYNPEKGRFYYRNTWLLINEFDYGITRHWSVGARFMSPFPGLLLKELYSSAGEYFLNTTRLFSKVSVPIGEKFRLAANVTYQARGALNLFGTSDLWTLQGLASVGTSQHQITVGYGQTLPSKRTYTYSTPLWSSSMPQVYTYTIPTYHFLTVGLIQKVSPGLTLVSDNRIALGRDYYTYDDARVTVSFACRIDRRRHAFDLGIYSLIYDSPYFYDSKPVRLFPYVGYNLLIGRN